MRKYAIFGMFISCALALAACAPRGTAARDTVFQYSTIHALMDGVYDGAITCGELRRQGDLGLGTYNALDGEMTLCDGVMYQIRADGSVARPADSALSPFATVTRFEADQAWNFEEPLTFEELTERLEKALDHPNLPCAFYLQGRFAYVKTRSVPRQNRPYPRLAEVVKTQPTFEFSDVEGTIVGFRLPGYFNGVNVPGWHFHFLTADRAGGGHLLAFRSNSLRAQADLSPEIRIALPTNEDFRAARLDAAGSEEELRRIEKSD